MGLADGTPGMDLTRKALEKARKGKPGGRPVFSLASLPAAKQGPEEIHYQDTIVVGLDEDVLRANRIVAALEDEPLADRYRILRAEVLRRLSAARHTTLAICSPGPGEGKTLTAVNLAISMAMDVNQTVLLVDLDLRRPSVARVLGIQPKAGIDDYIRGAAELRDCMVNPGTERLVILPARAPIDKSSEMLASPRMAQLAHELKNRYPDRIVIYDMPPLLTTDDCLAFMPYVDATLLVVAEGMTKEQELGRAMSMMRDSHVIGAILNNSTERQSRADIDARGARPSMAGDAGR